MPAGRLPADQRHDQEIRTGRRLRDREQVRELRVGRPLADLDGLPVHLRQDGADPADGQDREQREMRRQRAERIVVPHQRPRSFRAA